MNLRVTSLSLLLLAAVPMVGASVAHAQETDQVTALAREKFTEGVTAYDAGRFEEARSMFLQAYALKRHPAVLLNLGQSELKANYVEDGGNHLQQFLREHTTATEDQKNAAKAGIQEATRRTGSVILIVNADGADVAVDGKAVGKSPLLDPWFVPAGSHVAAAAKDGQTAQSSFDAKKGTVVSVQLTLGTNAPAVIPTPTPTPDPSVAPPPQPAATAPPGYPPPGPMGPPMQPMPPPNSYGADTGGGGREDFIDWFVDTPGAWVLGGVTGVGVIGGIAFGIAGGVASSSVTNVNDEILAKMASRGDTASCGPEDNPSLDVPFYANACNQLRDNISARNLDYALMGVFFGVGAAAAAGTVIYYFIDAEEEPAGLGNLRLTPVISPDTQGFGLSGSF
ncbi:MAG: hypothetical protein R3B72_14405 [Polyangiaceae bacterium]